MPRRPDDDGLLAGDANRTSNGVTPRILTPDQRLRVFVSSTLQELAPERAAACAAIEGLHLTPVLFELGARPHSPQDLYRAYLDQSDVFVGIYWQSYGWVGPGADLSGVADEYVRSDGKPRLVYVKEPAPEREEQLEQFLDRLRGEGSCSYKRFETADELVDLLGNDLAVLLAERFAAGGPEAASPADVLPATAPRILPKPMTSFIGRETELGEIEDLLDSEHRLLTLTGPGGIGKTRLAIEVAERVGDKYVDGIAFVALESLASPKLVLSAVSNTLALREVGGDPADGLVTYLQGRSMLLVLDNFEHVIGAATEVTSLLERASGLTVLITSRELLRVRGEREFRVQPLSAEGDAVRLFAERASATRGDFELGRDNVSVIVDICRRLDCVPLAIEVAAARMRLLSAGQLLERLSERLTIIGPRDAPERQQTLSAAIAWSYELLEPAERRVFERLSVFRGGFSLEGAEAVCGFPADLDVVEILGSLLDKSLVYPLPAARGRLAMLSMIREYAFAQLDRSGERDATLDRFSAYYLGLATEWDGAVRTVGADWIGPIDEEADNARAAIIRLLEQGRGADVATMIRGLWVWLWFRGQVPEAREFVRATFRGGGELAPEDRALLLLVDGSFAYFQADFPLAAAELEEAQELFEQTNDSLGAALALTVASMVRSVTVGKERSLSDLADALAVLEQGEDPWGVAIALSASSRIRSVFNDFDGAEPLLEHTLSSAEELGDPFLIVLALDNHAYYRLSIGDADGARAVIDRALELARTTGLRYGVDDLLEAYARLEADVDDFTRAAELIGTAEALREAIGAPLWGPLVERHKRLTDELKQALGEDEFDAACKRGRELPLEHWCKRAAALATSG